MIAIIDYQAGNLRSVENALKRLGTKGVITNDYRQIKAADKVIFPGVGEAGSAMRSLKATGLDKIIPQLKQPVLGICLGMQLLCKYSAEGNTDCLGVFNTQVKSFPPLDQVPHMGWNNLREGQGTLLRGIEDSQDFYFVHSYYAEVCRETKAICDYIVSFSALLEKDNFYATQFHPEKSAGPGEAILKNFLEL